MSTKSRLLIIAVTLIISSHAEPVDKQNKPLKWGIAAAGKICQDFANSLAAFSSDHKIVAVATHGETNVRIGLAKEKNVFLAEGLWSRYLPSYQFIRQQIREGKLGKIIRADAELGGNRTDPRFFVKELGGAGAILDFGVYGIDVMQWTFEDEPQNIKATGQLNDDGVDTNIQAEFTYSGNRKAQLKLSITEKLKNTIKIHGTKGSMEVPNFWFSTSLVDVDRKQHNWDLPTGARYPFTNTNRAGLVYEAEAVRKYIRAGKKESDMAPLTVSLGIASVQDRIRKLIGVVCLTDYNLNYITHSLDDIKGYTGIKMLYENQITQLQF